MLLVYCIAVLGCSFYAFTQGYFALVTFLSLVGSLAQTDDRKSSELASRVIWAYTLFIVVPPLFGWGHYGPVGYLTTCSFEHVNSDWNNRSYLYFMYWMGFLSPLAFLAKSGMKRGKTFETAVTRRAFAIYLILWAPYAILAFSSITFPQSFLVTPLMDTMCSTLSKVYPLCLPLAEIYSVKALRKST